MRELADSIRTSLNFYRTQDAAETVELGVVTGPAVAIPGFVERLGEALRLPLEARVVEHADGRRRRPPHGRRRPRRRRAPVDAPMSAPVRHTARAMSVGVAAVVAADPRSDRRLLPERGGLPAAAQGVPAASAFARARSAGRRSSPTTTCPSSGWLWLRGQAAAPAARRSRRATRSSRRVTGLLCAACVLRFGADSDVWLPLVFVLLLVPITLIDLDHHIIPNVLTGDRGGRPRSCSCSPSTPTRSSST